MYNPQRNSFWSIMPPVTKNLIIINVIVWAFMYLAPHSLTLRVMQYGALHYVEAPHFNVVQFFTYMFMHSTQGLTHILFNMFALFMFGVWIERAVGSSKFLFYYLSCGIGAALVQELAWYGTIDSIIGSLYGVPTQQVPALEAMGRLNDFKGALDMLQTVGASGAIYGVLLAFGMLFPNQRLSIMFLPIFVKAKWMVIGYGVLELLIGMSQANDRVAHFAHLGGMVFGFLIILYWKKKKVINGPFY